MVGFDDDFAAERILDVFQRDAAEHAVAEGLDDFAALHERSHFDAVHGAAIALADDGVLGHIHQPARQVAGVGGF